MNERQIDVVFINASLVIGVSALGWSLDGLFGVGFGLVALATIADVSERAKGIDPES